MDKLLSLLKTISRDYATARNGVDFSFTKAGGGVAILALTVKFCTTATPDYTAYANAVAIILAVFTAKYFVEDKAEK